MLQYRGGIFLISADPARSQFIGYRPRTGCIDKILNPVEVADWFDKLLQQYGNEKVGGRAMFECSYTPVPDLDMVGYTAMVVIDLPNERLRVYLAEGAKLPKTKNTEYAACLAIQECGILQNGLAGGVDALIALTLEQPLMRPYSAPTNTSRKNKVAFIAATLGMLGYAGYPFAEAAVAEQPRKHSSNQRRWRRNNSKRTG